MNGNAFDKIFSAASGVWALVLMGAVALFKGWPNIMGRLNERRRDSADERAGDWDRLRKERDRLRELLAHCEAERGEWMRRAITAEATLQGYGEVRQIRAISEATKRLSDGGE